MTCFRKKMVELRGVRNSWLTEDVKVSLCCDLAFSSWWMTP